MFYKSINVHNKPVKIVGFAVEVVFHKLHAGIKAVADLCVVVDPVDGMFWHGYFRVLRESYETCRGNDYYILTTLMALIPASVELFSNLTFVPCLSEGRSEY